MLVEDDKNLCYTLGQLFKKNRINVEFANTGDDGYWMCIHGVYDVIILDILLPGMSGFKILDTIRKEGNSTPILMLTTKDEIDDKSDAFNRGADDYLVKPFYYEELLLRLNALTRRSKHLINDSCIIVGNIQLDRRSFEVMMNGNPIKLTPKGAKLLYCLMKNKEKFVSKETLLNFVWGINKDIQSNSVEVYIHALRKNLPSEISGVTIETRLGFGYRIIEGAYDV